MADPDKATTPLATRSTRTGTTVAADDHVGASTHGLDALFDARSVVVVGASDSREKLAGRALAYLLDGLARRVDLGQR